MKAFLLVIGVLSAASATTAQGCDCTTYPFKPNPPCFGECVAKLSAKPVSGADRTKNIDPGVSVGIRVLSQSKERDSVDFESIRGKKDLEREVLKSMKAEQMKLEK
jgi:hypothetical protein